MRKTIKTLAPIAALLGSVCVGHAETLTLYCEGTTTSYVPGQAIKSDWKNTLMIDLERSTIRYATFSVDTPSGHLMIAEAEFIWDNRMYEPLYQGNIRSIGSINRTTGQYFNRGFNPDGTKNETEANCRPFKSRIF